MDIAEAALLEAESFPYGEIELWVANKATMIVQESPNADLLVGQVIGSGWDATLTLPATGQIDQYRVKNDPDGVAYSLGIVNSHVVSWPVEVRRDASLTIRDSRYERDGGPVFDRESGSNGLELLLPLTNQHILENLNDHECFDSYTSPLEDRELHIESSCLRHWRVRATGAAEVALRQCTLGGLETDDTAEVSVDYSTLTGEAPFVARGYSRVALRKASFHGAPATYDSAKMIFSEGTSYLSDDELADGSHDESLLAFTSVDGLLPTTAFDESLNAHLKLESLATSETDSRSLVLKGTVKGYGGPYHSGNVGFFQTKLVSPVDGSLIRDAGTKGASVENHIVAEFDMTTLYAGDYRAMVEWTVGNYNETLTSSLITGWAPPE